MTWMNEWEVDEALDRFDRVTIEDTPNLALGARILNRLRHWTNSNSDGWAYWPKPANSASKLMDVLHAKLRDYHREDITEADLKKALSPIKAFLTKQGVDHDRILRDPEPAVIPMQIMALPVTTDEGATFTPWSDGRCVGYKVSAKGKPDTYIYLNPSGAQDTAKLDDTDVFVYLGGDANPGMDEPQCYINIFEKEQQ